MDKKVNINFDDFIQIKPEDPAAINFNKLPYPHNIISKILDVKTTATEEQVKGFEHALSLLPEEEQLLLMQYFKWKENRDLIAADRGVSRTRVIQLVNKTLDKLRDFPFINYISLGFSEYDKYYQGAMEYLTELASLPEDDMSDRKIELQNVVKPLDIGFLGLPHAAHLKLKKYANCSTIEELISLCRKTGGDYSKYGWNFRIPWLGAKNREEIDYIMKKYRLLN